MVSGVMVMASLYCCARLCLCALVHAILIISLLVCSRADGGTKVSNTLAKSPQSVSKLWSWDVNAELLRCN